MLISMRIDSMPTFSRNNNRIAPVKPMLNGGDRVKIIYEDLTFVFRPASVLEANSLVVIARGTSTRVDELDVVCHCARSLGLVLIMSAETINSSLINRCCRVSYEIIYTLTTELVSSHINADLGIDVVRGLRCTTTYAQPRLVLVIGCGIAQIGIDFAVIVELLIVICCGSSPELCVSLVLIVTLKDDDIILATDRCDGGIFDVEVCTFLTTAEREGDCKHAE